MRMFTFKIEKRCFRCLHVLREDGTCQNPKCSRYVAEEDTSETKETPKTADTESK